MSFLHRSFQTIFIVLLVGIFIAQIYGHNSIELIAIFFLTATLFLLRDKIKAKLALWNPSKIKLGIGIALVVNLILLVTISLTLQINDVSDPLNLQIKATELANGNFNWHTDGEEYFYFYNNVVFFTIILSKVIQFAHIVGLSATLMIHLLSSLLLFGLSILSVGTVWNVTANLKKTFLSSLIVLIFPVMYLYPNLIVYTDTLTMFLTTLLLFFTTKVMIANSKYKMLGWGVGIAIAFAVVFLTKANLVILIPAVLGTVIIAAAMNSKYVKKLFFVLIALVIGTGVAVGSQAPITSHYGFNQQEKKEMGLPVTHWINMGLNTDIPGGHGGYVLADDNFARESKLDNNTASITDSIKNRLKSLGILGFYGLLVDKLQTLMGSPLFGYGKYQAGFSKAPDFYMNHESTIDKLLAILSTSLIFMLIIKMIAGIRIRAFKSLNEREQLLIYLVGIASFGLMLFHTAVWEVEPRYFLPLLYPLLLLSVLFEDNNNNSAIELKTSILNNKWMVLAITVGSVLLSVAASHETVKPTIMTSGNWEYEARVALFKQVPLTHTMTFKLPVEHDSTSIIINIPADSGIKIKAASGENFVNENNLNVLHGNFKKGTTLVVHIHPNDANPNRSVLLYKEQTLYKKLFHGSSIESDRTKYYLSYQFTK